MSKEWLADQIVERCLYVPQDGLMLGKMAGTRYASQYYLSNILYDYECLENIVQGFVDVVGEALNEPFDDQVTKFQVCGREWSSIPLLIALAPYVNVFMIRRERKNYGKHNYIEGVPLENTPVLIVDDLCNSTNSFVHCKAVLDEEGLDTVPYIFSVLNKYKSTDEGWEHDRYLGSSHKALSLLTGDDINAAKDRRQRKVTD